MPAPARQHGPRDRDPRMLTTVSVKRTVEGEKGLSGSENAPYVDSRGGQPPNAGYRLRRRVSEPCFLEGAYI